MGERTQGERELVMLDLLVVKKFTGFRFKRRQKDRQNKA